MPETIAERLAESDRPTISIEFFPPSDEDGLQQVLGTVDALGPLRPDWISVTYGATGAKRFKTFSAVGALRGHTDLRLVGHLTVAGQDIDEVRAAISAYERLGVSHLLALRGDPPAGERFTPHPRGLRTGTDLVHLIKEVSDASVGVAAFPEPHPEGSPDLDVQILLDKEKAGAEFAVTQLFFDPQVYVDLVARFRARGGTIPLVAGIMPVTLPSQIERFAGLSGSRMPPHVEDQLREVAFDKEAFRTRGIALMTQLCRDVLDAGAPGLQFFTLNRSTATREILTRLRADGAV